MEAVARRIIQAIEKFATSRINLMEVCGTHTMVIAKSGLRSMLPEKINLLSGPGCPVCVTPQDTIDYAIALSREKNVVITTFGDMVRVPGTSGSLEASSPKIVYSPLDALKVASENPGKDVVFIGVGFETTSPTIAATIIAAAEKKLKNFYVLPAFKLIPPALDFIASSRKINVHGFLLPGHVSVIIGSKPYEFLSDKYHLPGCVTGFEPIDILQGIYVLAKQIAEETPTISIEYDRVVKPEGNRKALELQYTVFEVCDARWRGIGVIPASGLKFSNKFERYDVRNKFDIEMPRSAEPRGCICGEVLLGLKMPFHCALFGRKCTPLTPVGPCMVSSEGACAAYYRYGNYTRQHKTIQGKRRRREGGEPRTH
jgi:hydrogenase expression/formation protein HypD